MKLSDAVFEVIPRVPLISFPGQMNADLDQKTEKSILKQAGLLEQ